MKRFLPLLILAAFTPHLAYATWGSVTQAVFNNSCGAVTNCAVTVSVLGAGHLIFVPAHTQNSAILTSVTASGETFTTLGINGNSSCVSATPRTGCGYVLKSVGGATTVTCNWDSATSASGTTCGVYEVPYTTDCGSNPSIFIEGNRAWLSQGSASTWPGFNFNQQGYFINGTNDIIFQFENNSAGTISSIDTSFVLDNHVAQVADAHKLNTFDNTVPTWTNSGAATSIVTAVAFGENFCIQSTPAQSTGMTLSWAGTPSPDGTQSLTITSPGLFKLVFDAVHNWGATWYDLVNDPSATTNLLLTYGVGSQDAAISLNGLFSRTFYDSGFSTGDTSLSDQCAHNYFPNSPKSLNILAYNPLRVVLETKSEPCVTAQGMLNDVTATIDYYIYSDGRIYIHCTTTYVNGATPKAIFTGYVQLQDPTQIGTNPPDTKGWIRCSTTQCPYTGVSGAESYLFAYYSPSTPAPYTNFTKASILIVRSPNNLHDQTQILHEWGSGTGFGTIRWGWVTPGGGYTVGVGGTDVEDLMVQLGTQNSIVLPNINSSVVADPIANAYIANPSPPPFITPFDPVVAVSGTSAFSCTTNCGSGGTWSCANASNGGTCLGSINSGSGVYTAPASLAANQSLGGYQLFPNDHIFNTNIASLPTRSDSATLIAGAGTVPVNYLPSFGFNYTNGSTPTDNLNFYYTPANNAAFQSPPWPNAIEGGWFDAITYDSNADHHFITADTTNGNLSERYQFYGQAAVTSCTINGSNSGTCTFTPTTTSAGFARASALGRPIQMGGWTAGDTYLNGSFTLTGATTTTFTINVTHGAASTSTSGQATLNTGNAACALAGTCNSQSGVQYTYKDYLLPPNASTDAAGMFLAPLTLHTQEVVNACANGTAIKHALRVTLQNGFLHPAFLWPATAFANAGAGANYYGERVRLKSAFDISGFSSCGQKLLTQMKNYGLIFADGGYGWQIQLDIDNTTPMAVTALKEINAANIATSNWEVVDESSLMEQPFSGAASNGEIVTFTSSTGTATSHVDLQGTALSTSTHQYYIMAGTPQQQLTFYSNGAFTCAMSPTVGSITSDCKYTAPASEASVTTTTVTATSSVNAAVKAQMIVYVTPATIRLIQATADYVDSHSNTWYSGGAYGIGMSNIPSWQGCCNADNEGSFSGTDKQLFWNQLASAFTIGDFKMDFYVPAGTYKVTFNNGTLYAVGGDVRYFYAQGGLIGTVDSTASAGGQFKNWSLVANVTVNSNNKLSFYNAGIGAQTSNTGDVSSISIEQIAAAATAAPKSGTVLLP